MGENIEDKVKTVGREIYPLIGQEVPSLFDSKTWNGRLSDWVMKDDALKVPLFRFVDVLPCLKTDSLVCQNAQRIFRGHSGQSLLAWPWSTFGDFASRRRKSSKIRRRIYGVPVYRRP